MRERRRDYELMLIISPLHSGEEEVAAILDRLTQSVSSLGGELVDFNHSAPWGRRKFAYPIRAYSEGEASRRVFTEGFYVLLHFKLPTDQITEFERPLKLTDAILRYMLTSAEPTGEPTGERATVPAGADEDAAGEGDEDEG
jgi:small subunit ribosomal protein S6